jgi:molybdenum cofactor cytidylyltransferase
MIALKISAVVLAAGGSTRMDGRHKLLLELGGEALIRRTVKAVLGIEPVETLVVTGFGAAAIAEALSGLPVRLVHNRDWEQGQPGSVATGLRALEQHCHVVAIVPGDQALLTAEDLRALIAAYRDIGERSILVPFHRGERGMPVLIAAHHIPVITGGGLNIGCRHLIDTHADQAARLELDSDAFSIDCDTPEDYARLQARFG